MSKIYGYIRISTNNQNSDRQYDTLKEYEKSKGVKFDCIFEDKQSGRDFERPQYKILKDMVKTGDTIIVVELDRFGRNYEDIKTELNHFYQMGVRVNILDLPTFQMEDTSTSTLINNIVFELLSYIAEKERIRIQNKIKEGLKAARARGTKVGRPYLELSKEFIKYYKRWKKGEFSKEELAKLLNVSRHTIYRWIDIYENKRKKAS